MKIMKLALTTFAAAAVLGAWGIAEAGPVAPNRAFDIKFTGYCDGMHLVVNHNTGRVTGNQTGCVNLPVNGFVGSNSAGGLGIVVITDSNAGPEIYSLDDNPMKFTVRTYDDSFTNAGSYTLGVPGLAPNEAPALTSSGAPQ